MDIERTLETQRLRLLRILAGLVVLLGVLAIGPVSRRFSDWILGFVGSVLSRAEASARYLLITQACLMVDQCGFDIDRSQIAVPAMPDLESDEVNISLIEIQRRLRVLRSVLMDLPRYALRLLRRIAKQARGHANHDSPDFSICASAPLNRARRAARRIERPPDKDQLAAVFFLPSPGYRAGGVSG